MNDLRRFGPRSEDAPPDTCKACDKDFKLGDYTTLISLGPGDDQVQMKKAREGHSYNAVAIQVHYHCATGEE